MLRVRVLPFKHAIELLLIAQILMPEHFPLTVSLMAFLSLSVTKYFFEGFRASCLSLILFQLILLVTKSVYFGAIMLILMVLEMVYFPIYKYPEPTGKYQVGYKMIKVYGNNKPTSVGVYYPTFERTKDVSYSPSHDSWVRFADLMRFYAELNKKGPIPKWIFRLCLSFLPHQYLGVNADAKIANLDNNKPYPVVVFSHGLSGNIHLYSIQLKEWASYGFIVFSVDHDEEIHLNVQQFKSHQDYLIKRNEQLGDRKRVVAKMLDLAHDQSFINSLFGTEKVALNYKKVFVAGHSFGGATAAETAVEDKRITGGIMLLDPWFECCDEKVLFQEIQVPVLSFRSTTFNRIQVLKDKIVKHAKDCNANKGEVVSGLMEGSSHNSCTDLLILMPTELQVTGGFVGVKRTVGVQDQIIYHSLLMKMFLEVALEYEKSEKNGAHQNKDIKTLFLLKFRAKLKELGKEDIFLVDE